MANSKGSFWARLVNGPVDLVETFSEPTPEAILPPSRNQAGMSPDAALGLIPVYRSVQILTTVAAQLDLKTYRNDEEIKPTPLIAKQPDSDRTRSAFIKRTVGNLALTGNAFWHITRNNRGEATNLRVLSPSAVSVGFHDNGKKFYDYFSGSTGKTVRYTDRQVQHLRLMEVDGSILGLGPIQAARFGLARIANIDQYADEFFDRGGVPRSVLKSTEDMTPEEIRQNLEGWYEMLQQGGTAMLPRGMGFDMVALSPADAQWIDSQQFSKTQISTLMGIPPVFLSASVDGNSMTYTSTVQLNQIFYQTTLLAYIQEIEDAFSAVLPNRNVAKFDTTSLLRADDRARFETYAIGIKNGFLTVNDVREQENLPPLPKPEPVAEPEPIEPEPEEEAND